MREFLLKLFSDNIGGPDITLFGFFHILYLLITIGVTVFMSLFFRNKTEKTKKLVLDIYATLIVCLYLGDFFVHPFMNAENALIVDKLPFHICTAAAVMIAITRIFPNKTKLIQHAVPVLGLVGAFAYIAFPNGAVGEGVKAFSYRMIQTFLYHGCVVTYGVLTMALDENRLEYKKIYVEAIMIVLLELISLGANAAYTTADHHYDWFFTTGSSFGINEYLMPFLVFAAIFGMVNIVYLIYYGVLKINSRKKAKEEDK